MRKIVIFKDEQVQVVGEKPGVKKNVRTTLRTIRPDATWEGYSQKTGEVIESKMRLLASVLEPTSTGCYSA